MTVQKEMKFCSKCGETKPRSAFHKDRTKKDEGLSGTLESPGIGVLGSNNHIVKPISVNISSTGNGDAKVCPGIRYWLEQGNYAVRIRTQKDDSPRGR